MMRGQTFPLWIGNILLTLVFSAFIVSYGYLVSIQMRVQAVADSVAAGAVAIQSQQFNQMIAGLYASAVEEYRLRHLLESYRLASMGAGGCATQSPDCDATWLALKKSYSQSVARYDQDVRYVNDVTTAMDFETIKGDARQFAGLIDEACRGNAAASLAGKFTCGDKQSPISVKLVDLQLRRKVQSGRADAINMVLPSYYALGTYDHANPKYFIPVKAEVVACASVPLFFSWIPGLQNSRQLVSARGAAANALVEQDWFQPGYIKNAATNDFYQPLEKYGPPDEKLPLNWYLVNYGGDPNGGAANTNFNQSAPRTSQITAAVHDEAFIVKTGWWGPVPIFPFVGGSVPAADCPGNADAK